ncbi:MAG: hypothetical protein HGB08_04000 [Candidatus Moranbacteria bacterium]|nr:hypothetical protein [Candidatus Moranbacteria bacterium]
MIIGHQKIRNGFKRSLEKESLSQAYIFTGPESVGKFTFALDLTSEINGIGTNIDPDLVILSPRIEETKGVEKVKDISIDEIRELQGRLGTTPGHGKHMIAIINDADRLTKGAQNGLLKILEEPPENSVLFLIVSNMKRILPTVVSRCQTKKFSLMTDKEISELAGSAKDREEIIFWSFGRPGWAKRMIEDSSLLDENRDILKQLKDVISADLNGRFDLAENLAKDQAALSRKLAIWAALLRQTVLGNDVLGISPARALRMIDLIDRGKSIMGNTNANARLALENMFINI